ncbi:MAG: haloalkane dehalogenase [Pirellulales bacterium]
MQVLRTPDERFANLPDFPYAPHYVDVSGGLRMHYVEAGRGDEVILCLHGEPSWCFLYRRMIPLLAEQGRVIAPDLIGFGRSDKPAAREAYTFGMHSAALTDFIKALDLQRITLVCQDWGGLLGLPIATQMPERFSRLVIMNTGLPVSGKPLSPAFMAWRAFATKSDDLDIARVLQGATVSELSPAVLAGYAAPYPDKTYKAGAIVFPLLVPISEDAEALPHMRRAAEVFKSWQKPVLVMFSDKDPVTAGGDKFFRELIPTAKNEPEITIRDGGHFLQEDKGPEIATHIVEFIKRRPVAAAQ